MSVRKMIKILNNDELKIVITNEESPEEELEKNVKKIQQKIAKAEISIGISNINEHILIQ
ncbi:MAG: hypothetical protein IJP99_05755 [Methanobrevibacter sp.]|nr:hypothetical protein [Methanobrevibacter sp.]